MTFRMTDDLRLMAGDDWMTDDWTFDWWPMIDDFWPVIGHQSSVISLRSFVISYLQSFSRPLSVDHSSSVVRLNTISQPSYHAISSVNSNWLLSHLERSLPQLSCVYLKKKFGLRKNLWFYFVLESELRKNLLLINLQKKLTKISLYVASSVPLNLPN